MVDLPYPPDPQPLLFEQDLRLLLYTYLELIPSTFPGLADSRKPGLGKMACEAAAVAFGDFMLGARASSRDGPA